MEDALEIRSTRTVRIMPLTNTNNATLLLDLDGTTFIAITEAQFLSYGASTENIKKAAGIHPNHLLSSPIKNGAYYFYVLNPQKLKKMIEAIYEQNDDIIIFTSGLWLKPVLHVISQLCELSVATSLRFSQSLFLNPQHDSEKLGYPEATIQTLLKGYRLHGLFRQMPALRDRHFILLDNDSAHIASCKSCHYLEGILASTNTTELGFYDTVLKQMKLIKTINAARSPHSTAYNYPEEILRAFINLKPL